MNAALTKLPKRLSPLSTEIRLCETERTSVRSFRVFVGARKTWMLDLVWLSGRTIVRL